MLECGGLVPRCQASGQHVGVVSAIGRYCCWAWQSQPRRCQDRFYAPICQDACVAFAITPHASLCFAHDGCACGVQVLGVSLPQPARECGSTGLWRGVDRCRVGSPGFGQAHAHRLPPERCGLRCTKPVVLSLPLTLALTHQGRPALHSVATIRRWRSE